MSTQNYHSIKNAALITPATATDLGSVAQPYGNLYLQGNITLNNATTITSTSAVNPKITSVTYPGSATAADPAGGQTITINGSGFASGATTYVAGVIISVTNFVSSTQLTFTSPAKTAGSYTLSVVNTDGGTASYIPGLTYSALPVWSTSAGSLGSSYSGSAISTINLSASENAQTITYAVTSGTLPTGLSLSSVGALTGTPTGSAATYNFTVTATDPQNQTASRNFSYTLSAPPTITLDVLIVAGGGGGGGGQGGGGGGAGGLAYGSLTLTPGTQYTVTVGGGGSGYTYSSSAAANNGSDSLLSTYRVYGGGRGATNNGPGGDGGSGGGGEGYQTPKYGGNQNLGSVSPLTAYGEAGGTGQAAGIAAGGGGGGAGVAGGAGNGGAPYNGPGGKGGNGRQYNITGSNLYFAGGGGGGCGPGGNGNGFVGGDGGTGGGGGAGGNFGGGGSGGGSALNPGGNGGTQGPGGAGGENTGGGGGGGAFTYNGLVYTNGGAGGSGVVIIRYADTYSAASATTGSPTYTTPTGYRVYMFTSSGSITF